ncbi:glycoside hydrolase domain-containing protein [Evansella halocellulosilytica]|uniref:glycoside hydrolase domain-containing protein n=1 Tax=Evansella halocellulosilytica TaxID=2011013 RepID=UPI00211B7525|nr:glycoside hydrolase domain-containing protein [Evansella halocellulosilytica]
MVKMIKKRFPFIVAFVLVMMTSFAFIVYSTQDDAIFVGASDSGEEPHNQSDVDSQVDNQIENNINSDGAQIDSSIENHISGQSEIDNSIKNEIDGEKVNNQLVNEIDSDGSNIENILENEIIGANGADINNDLQNEINGGSNNQITNNITNNIEVNINVDSNGGNETENDNGDKNGSDSNDNGENGNGEVPESIWGVDSASLTDEDMLACVRENFGDPEIWARYLGDKEGVSYGLTNEEIELLHSNDIDIMVIWNHFEDATGYEKGQSEASDAIEMAQDLDIPEGVALFANVEPIYPVDSDFILGWYDTLAESEYNSGVYGIFDPDEELYVAYEEAANENSDLLDHNYVWTSSPEEGITTEGNAPEYNPEAPEGSLLAGWQYGIDAETCNIDTNLFDGEVLDVLWTND